MQSALHTSQNSSLPLTHRIISKARSQKQFSNYFRPTISIKPSLLSLKSPKDAILNPVNNFSTNSIRIRHSLSKKSLNPKTPSQIIFTQHRSNSIEKDPKSKLWKELNEYEQKEICEFDEVYYAGTRDNKVTPNSELNNYGYDNESGQYRLIKGDHLAYRFQVLAYIGKGSFGVVCECFDFKARENVAVKILKNKKHFHRQGMIEISILQAIKDNDPKNEFNVCKMKQYFIFRNHICMVFELFNISLYDMLKISNFQPMDPKKIKEFTLQILKSLEFLEANSIIHCDLKPENLLFASKNCEILKIIDFGSSCFAFGRVHTYIQSRFYRSPEVILGIPYTCAIDIWSLGCIIAELSTGEVLLQGENELEQIMLIIELLGLPPKELRQEGSKSHIFFDKEGNFRKKCFENDRILVPGSRKFDWENSPIFSFIKKCLEWDSNARLTPKQALLHPWLKKPKHKSLSTKRLSIKLKINKTKL
jgi:dual specificity tyrosine-phosphorylation-regulated kinase 2/3/4